MGGKGLLLIFATLTAAVAVLAASTSPIIRMTGSAIIAVNGVITSTNCPSHEAVSYSFEVGGRTVAGSSSSGRCAGRAAGDRIRVWYSQRDPNINTLTPPSPGELIMTTMLAVLFGAAATALIYVRSLFRRWR